jgi:hypothetical protein
MVYHSDDTKQRLTTLNRLAVFDPIKIERDLLMSHSRLVNLPEISSKKSDHSDSKERQTRLNQFLQFCTDQELLISGNSNKHFVFFQLESLDVDHILKQFVFECITLNTTENTNEQQTSRSSSVSSNDHEDEKLRLTDLNDEESKQSSNTQTIIWDDPFELLTTNEQTGRIGLSTDTLPSSPTSRSIEI